MRILRSHSVLAAPTLLALFAAVASAQEPAPTPAPKPAPEQPAATEQAPPAAEAPAGERRRGGRRQAIVIEAAVVHPVNGPAIENGVVVIRGERIAAIGKKGEVELPENANVRSFPTGHVYPGLIDAQTDAFTDNSLRNDEGSDGGALFADDLRRQDDRGDELVQAGITTAYVTVRSPALVRGQGAIVRPRNNGFEPWRGREHAALQLRMTGGPQPSHALQRQQQLQAVDALFEGLEEFRKARTDHAEALKKYEKEFADYLAFHQKKKDEKKPEGAAAPAAAEGERPARPAEGQGPPREGRPRGNRGDRPPVPNPTPNPTPDPNPPPTPEPKPKQDSGPTAEQLEAALATLFEALAQDPPKPQDPPKTQEPKPAEGAGATPPAAAKPEDPKRPTYPKAPPPDPQREALLKVLDGELPLRVEAHRPDELRAALRMQRERNIPQLIVEQAYGAASIASDFASQGVSVVLTETLPGSMPEPYEAFDTATLPSKLQAAGVPFALATGRARSASMLPLIAAAAAGAGLDRDAALRAITLTPAEILGIAQDTGSLQAGKLADVLVTDRPLFATDCRVLLVLARGRTEFEVK